MQVTIRKARAADRKQYDWKTYYVGVNGPFPPTVVTVDGALYLVLQGREVVYQNGSDAIPNLVRMVMRYYDIQDTLFEDAQERRRKEAQESASEAWDFLRNAQ